MTTLINSNTSAWTDLFLNRPFEPTPEPVIKTQHDTLVLSAHLWNSHQGRLNSRFNELSSVDSYYVQQDDDVQLAAKISQHFGRQILVYALAGKLTRWQEGAEAYLRGDRRGYTRKNQGLIFRLPEYYFKDLEIAEMDERHFSECTSRDLEPTTQLTLEPVQVIGRNLSNGKKREYWFLDRQNNTPAMVAMRTDTELLYIWDHYFATKRELVVDGKWTHTRHPRGVKYYSTVKARLVNL